MSKALRVIEAAYAPAPSDQAWLQRVAEVVAREVGAEAGGIAYFVRWQPRGLPETRGWLRVAGATEADLQFAKVQHEMPISEELATEASRVYSRGAMLSGTREAMGELTTVFEGVHGNAQERTGHFDTLNLLCMDATHEGVNFLHPARDRVKTHPRERALWTRVASHVTAGLRMLRGTSANAMAEGADAILDPDGRVVDATPRAQSSLEALRLAARAVDRARLRSTPDDEALDLWKCLFSGEYSVVDRFDTDGKRLFIAKKNAPVARGPRALTERERQVLALVSVGHSDKSAAYELGIAEGTVAGHLHSGLKKLGLTSATDLGILRATLGAP
ncbi:MAG: LuxR C-terminal-related transcriptional regulator [Polyangiaceae bacterium]